jgi:leader peptidase (prepilin peptidase)/N-methyltransferase
VPSPLGAHPELAAYLVLGLGLVALAAADLERYIIPNRILYPTAALATPLLVLASGLDGHWGDLVRALACALVAFLAFFLLHLLWPKGMGFGDVRLAGLVAGAAGWYGVSRAYLAILVALVLGSLVGIVVALVTGAGRKARVPFGIFLAAGAVIAVVAGAPLVTLVFPTSR